MRKKNPDVESTSGAPGLYDVGWVEDGVVEDDDGFGGEDFGYEQADVIHGRVLRVVGGRRKWLGRATIRLAFYVCRRQGGS
jgi:hypothetical protein